MKTKDQTARRRNREAAALTRDDVEQYSKYSQAWFDKFQPSGDAECSLVQYVVDTGWRLKRAGALATYILSVGASHGSEFPAALERLGRYEAKLSREFHKGLDLLLKTQKKRKAHPPSRPNNANRTFSFWIDQIDPSKAPN